jgi:alkanesulfonate monooxygenase
MSIRLHWYLPTNGDSREIVGSGDDSHLAVGPSASPIRPPTIAYLGEIARTAELLGFESVLTPTGSWCEDAWITTSALSQVTTRLKFLVAFRPGFISPTLAAHQAATFQRVSGGRLLLNIVTGGDPVEQARFGDHLDHDCGAGTALVGSHTEVADRIAEYHDLGIDHFILSGQPHVEEAYWFAEGAGSVLRARGLV